jgi:S-formylglutathione hydrolase FrmB
MNISIGMPATSRRAAHGRAAVIVLAASVWLGAGPVATTAATVEQATFPSESLGHDVSYSVQLPPSYASGKGPYPTLYVLHGLFENNAFWERRGLSALVDQLWGSGEIPEMVIVAVDGGNSFFLNGPGGRFEDLATHDIVSRVESGYRVVPGREGRALLGISMGGYAALRIAFTHPEAFRAVATHSAMLLLKAPTREEGAGRWHMAAFNKVFGDPIDASLWEKSDPLALAAKANPRATPELYFDCGSEDRYGLFAGNQELHRRLAARSVRHQFSLHPGDHGYEYVRTVLPDSLRFLGGILKTAGAPGGAPTRKAKP